MFAFLPGIPGADDVRAIVRRVDTARHKGVPNGCVLELDLLSVPPETSGFDPLAMISSGGRPMVLRQAVAAIHRAAEDDRVAGLIARVQISAAPAAPVQELRDAIVAFSAVKPSVAWAETYPGTLSYYLASAFREVWMQPSGTVGLVGFATSALFLRDALDKAGIEAQFVAKGEYKSAANLFTQDRYTEPHREADSRLIESLNQQVLAGVAASRNLETKDVDALADKAPLLRDDAVTGGLVDRIGFRDEAYARIAELSGAEGITPRNVDGPDAPPRLFLSRYARATAPGAGPSIPGRKAKPTIAVVTLHGPIVSGRGGPGLLPSAIRAPGATPSPPRCAKRPPTRTSRPSCCGSRAPADRSPVRRPSGVRCCAPAKAVRRSSPPWVRSPHRAATTSRWAPTRSSPTQAPSPDPSAW